VRVCPCLCVCVSLCLCACVCVCVPVFPPQIFPPLRPSLTCTLGAPTRPTHPGTPDPFDPTRPNHSPDPSFILVQGVIRSHFGSKLDSSRHGLPIMTKVVALEFGRSPQWFLDCLIGGERLEKHRSAMLEVGRPCTFGPEGAKLLVGPEEVNDVLLHLSIAGVTFDKNARLSWDELRPRHVIVSEALEAEVMAALAETPGSGADGGKGKDQVKVKRRAVINIPHAAWHSQADEGFDTTKVLCSLSL
jgi:hypothetical protein